MGYCAQHCNLQGFFRSFTANFQLNRSLVQYRRYNFWHTKKTLQCLEFCSARCMGLQSAHWARVNWPQSRPQPHLPKRRPMPFFSPRYGKSKMGLKKKIVPDPKEKVAKVATKNSQNRHLAEFRQAI